MYSLTAQNDRGETLELTHNEAFSIVSTDGFDPPDAIINTTTGANTDGGFFNSARFEVRTIALTIAVNSPALDNRLVLYKFFTPKSLVKLIYKTEARELYTEGYVQTMPVDLYAPKEIVQVTIICPNPYLMRNKIRRYDFAKVESLFEFPFSIEAEGIPFSELTPVQSLVIDNEGDLPVGFNYFLQAHGGSVVNPKIINSDTGEYMQYNLTLADGDAVYASTKRGQKYVGVILQSVESNGLRYLVGGSTFFELRAGECSLVLDATSGSQYIGGTIDFEEHFAGV